MIFSATLSRVVGDSMEEKVYKIRQKLEFTLSSSMRCLSTSSCSFSASSLINSARNSFLLFLIVGVDVISSIDLLFTFELESVDDSKSEGVGEGTTTGCKGFT